MTTISGHLQVADSGHHYNDARKAVQKRAQRHQDAQGDGWTASYSFAAERQCDGFWLYRYCVTLTPDTPSQHHSGELFRV